ncbi:MAG: hypothetical protein HQ575_04210 [Candidatus Omnitrophica bacterium]|nr:hypothetical protein [Candidatus Omnitrophota bacterium]
MRIAGKSIKLFKMKNRKGFAALCDNHLTEGKTRQQAVSRMSKALKRKRKRTT